MNKLISPIQPLILTESGAKPTIPSPSTIMPSDPRFNIQSDLMIGQLAYNAIDDEWFYRSKSAIQSFLKSTELSPDKIESWRDDRIYKADNTFISYINSLSSNTLFNTKAIYRCVIDTLIGESPETHPNKWAYQGASVIVNPTTVTDIVTLESASLFDPTKENGYILGDVISYINETSQNEQFRTLQLYIANLDIQQGISPEDSLDWVFRGQSAIKEITYPTVRVISSINAMRHLSNNLNGDISIIRNTGEIYLFNSSISFSGIRPINTPSNIPGRWELVVHKKIEDAPTGGKIYGRTNQAWTEIISSQLAYETESVNTEVHPRWDSSPTFGRDAVNFSFLPSGFIDSTRTARELGQSGFLWSSTSVNSLSNFAVTVNGEHTGFMSFPVSIDQGLSVRLVRNFQITDGKKIDGTILKNVYTDNNGNVYNGVIIGDLVWLMSNLRTTRSNTNQELPIMSSSPIAAYSIYPHAGIFNTQQEMVNAYGILYNGYSLNNLSTPEWRIPSIEDFSNLNSHMSFNFNPGMVGDLLKSARQVGSTFQRPVGLKVDGWYKLNSDYITAMTQGHAIVDENQTFPQREILKLGNGFTVKDFNETTTVVEINQNIIDHIDSTNERKHSTNQIINDLQLLKLNLPVNSPLNTILQSIDNFLQGTINTSELNTTGWELTERRLAVLERTVNGIQIGGAAQLLDIFAPPGVEASLRDNSGWANETKTLTGDNSTGQLGQKGAMIWLNDAVYAQCTSAILGVSGSATYRRNRAVDVLDPVNNTQDAAIANELDPSYTYPAMTSTGNSTDNGWNLTSQVKVITGRPTRWGMWFIGGINGDGYTYHCFLVNGTTSYWKRTGTPSSISRCIYAATHPNLTTRLLAHDFGTGAYTQVSGDEATYADQTFYDATTRSYFIKMINGNWEKIR